MKDIELFVIIVTYNAMPWIKKCLDSVLESTVKSEIIIVDNCSTDETVSFIDSQYNGVTILKQSKNFGFGCANNIGISFALKKSAKYIYLLNQDAWVKSDTFDILINQVTANKNFGIVSPMQLNRAEDKLDKNFSYYCSPNLCYGFLDDLFFDRIKTIYKTTFVNAAHWLITRECIMTVGGFSPSFYHYGEDHNYIDRLHFHGFDVGICTSAIAIHDREDRSNSTNGHAKQQYRRIVEKLSRISNKEKTSMIIALAIFLIIKNSLTIFIYKTAIPLYYSIKISINLPKILKNRNLTKIKGPAFLNF
ncbi:MAG: glycosyltransferase [Treponema sp.]|jgi:GT2 family glycosyltransferase|nr:glycosyltransferase [Treponema sp.]